MSAQPVEAANADERDTWLSQGERGTVFLIHATFRLAQLIGRTLMKPLVCVIALFYRLTDKQAVVAPRDGLRRVHDRIEAGDFVALLGDRTGLNERTVEATFFGQQARFPAGPFLLASLMKCPVYLTFGLYRRPNRYDLSCEPFADRLHLPRRKREAALQEVVQRYADRLEHYARSAPDNWFNFYDFWQDDTSGDGSAGERERTEQPTE